MRELRDAERAEEGELTQGEDREREEELGSECIEPAKANREEDEFLV